MTALELPTHLNDEQLAAVDAEGEVFVSAGAGTGKTSVLVERYVRAVCDRGLDVESILVITYTRKAAGELRTRIRAALHERGRPDLARALDGAWISTVHGFCNRLLKAHPFTVGLDPRFRELDDPGAAVLRGEAFERALASFCAEEDAARLGLLATYGADALRRMLTGVYETLRSAGRELVLELGRRQSLGDAVDELRDAALCLADDVHATETQRRTAGEALRVVASGVQPERVADLSGLRARGERAATYESARRAVERTALEELAARDRDLLQELLERFADAYAEAKKRESAVDFEDLQLLARDLLRIDSSVREAESERFRLIMVDEFQDTNSLQCELVDLLSRPRSGGAPAGQRPLLSTVSSGAALSAPRPEREHPPVEYETERFFVGDEFQSIYGFRHADVGVFRERRSRAENLLSLQSNYRSRPEVLAAVNYLFGEEFGNEYQPLAASREFPDPVFGHPVELLVTDKESLVDSGEHWRRAEARQIATRVRELVDDGAAAPGEIVLLFAAGTDAEWYEEELRRVGLPTYRATGRGYFAQQQVADLLAYLRLLRNRYDDHALATVLASPFVGVSNDALVLLRRHAGRRPLFSGLERAMPPGLGGDDERLLRAFRQRYERLVVLSQRVGLERLCEEILVEHDYDLAVLARWDGRRRYANLRKLARLARSYETLRGADVEGFVRFVREQDTLGAKELEAVAEEEGGDAVRLLTIHAAKGLEFKVVVVADAGRDTGGTRDPDEIVALSDGRFGFRVVHPTSGDREPVFDYEAVQQAGRAGERAERLRLYYVAMTRAVDRLIVSGAIHAGRQSERETPIGWVLARLGAAEELETAGPGPVEIERGDARFLVRVERGRAPAAEADMPLAAAGGQLTLFGELPEGPAPVGVVLPELFEPPAPPAHDVRRLSFSALALFERCSYRYWAERVAGMRPTDAAPPVEGAAEPIDGLHATEIGDAVHRLLEELSLSEPRPPSRAEIDAAVRAWYPAVADAEVDRIAGLVEAWCGSPLARRLASLAGARPERPFAFEHDGVLIHGRVDVLWHEGPRALVLDYKTNALADEEPAEVVEHEYRLQRLVYALALLLAGAAEVEVAYVFLERPDDVVSVTFTAGDRAVLEAELSAAIATIRAGEFRPTPSAFVCSGCPALDVVCAGPKLTRYDMDGVGGPPSS
jgi:ATP-dependent helicase/nuclease subunit A